MKKRSEVSADTGKQNKVSMQIKSCRTIVRQLFCVIGKASAGTKICSLLKEAGFDQNQFTIAQMHLDIWNTGKQGAENA